jgi:hypothetical protein
MSKHSPGPWRIEKREVWCTSCLGDTTMLSIQVPAGLSFA